MQPDTPTDYTALHACRTCLTTVHLRVFPHRVGWLVGTGCECRGKDGGPLRYSIENPVHFPTFEAADDARKDLLNGTELLAA